MVYAANHQILCQKPDGTTSLKNMLADEPRVLFRNKDTPLSVSFRFTCSYNECSCRLTKKQRESQLELGVNKLQDCPFKRRIKFIDSILMIQQPLGTIIDNFHIAITKEKIPLNEAFVTTKLFCDERQFSTSQFEVRINMSQGRV